MKLGSVLKAGGKYEIYLVDGSKLMLAGPTSAIQLDRADDVDGVVYFKTVVASGRHKGEEARTVVPYSSISRIVVTS